MTKEVGQFLVHYSNNSEQIVIAFVPHSTYLSTHLEVYKRLQGIAKPTGNYSCVTFNENAYLGVHFENNIPEDILMHALGD